MGEEYGLQLSLSLPPAAQYAKGDMLNIRGATPEEFEANLKAFLDLAPKYAVLERFLAVVEMQTKENLEAALVAPESVPVAEEPSAERVLSGVTDKQVGLIKGLARRKDIDNEKLLALASKAAHGKVSNLSDLTKKEASALIDTLQNIE